MTDHLFPGVKFERPGDDFGPGPWAGEPGRVAWYYRDRPCLMVRNGIGVWCGYVAVDPGHPAHGKPYEELEHIDAHGGLTFANRCADDRSRPGHVCHVPREGEPDDVWWLGFDTAHLWDIVPNYPEKLRNEELGCSYKSAEWVKAETERLADLLLADAKG